MKIETKQIKWEANGLLISEAESPYREVCHLGDSEFLDEDSREHASLIVRAVNSHGALLEALKGILGCDERNELHRDQLDTNKYFRAARVAVSDAETEVQP